MGVQVPSPAPFLEKHRIKSCFFCDLEEPVSALNKFLCKIVSNNNNYYFLKFNVRNERKLKINIIILKIIYKII